MEKYFKNDYVVHIEGYADRLTIQTLDKKIYHAILDIIKEEQIVNGEHSVIEVQKQDENTYEIFLIKEMKFNVL